MGLINFFLCTVLVFIIVIVMQNGLDTKVEKSRKQVKERKNRAKKIRGVKKVIEMNSLSFMVLVVEIILVYGFWVEQIVS